MMWIAPHPGGILAESIALHGMSYASAGAMLNLDPAQLEAIAKERAPITRGFAVALEIAGFGYAGFWRALQAEYDNDQRFLKTPKLTGVSLAISYDPEINLYYGSITGLRGDVNCYGKDHAELCSAAADALKDFILDCFAGGVAPFQAMHVTIADAVNGIAMAIIDHKYAEELEARSAEPVVIIDIEDL